MLPPSIKPLHNPVRPEPVEGPFPWNHRLRQAQPERPGWQKSYQRTQQLLRALPVCAGLLTLTLPAWSQTAPAGDYELHRQRQEQRLEEQKQRLDELRRRPALETPAPTPAHKEQTCFPIQKIEITGAQHLDTATLGALTAPFENRCLNASDIDAILRLLTGHYLKRGHITTRAYLPEQELSTGTLKITLIEGILENIQAAPGSNITPRELAMAFPGQTDRILALREIEQMLDQINRLPAKRSTVELEPGEHPGTSRALISTPPEKPWRITLGRHNNGDASTGEHMLDAGLGWDSPLGLADQLILRAGRSLGGNTKNGLFNYNIPWGWWTAAYSFSYSDYKTDFDNGDFLLETKGWSRAHDLHLERVVHRDDISKTAISAALNQTETKNYIEDIRLDISSVRLTEAGIGVSHSRQLGGAYINLDLGWQRGLTLLGAERDKHLPKEAAHAQYNKYTLTGSLLFPFNILSQNLSLESMAFWQHSEDVLHSPRQVSLGGQSSVRGFQDQTLYGSTGGYWRTQIGWNHAVPWPWLQPVCQDVGLALAWDIGAIERDDSNRYTGQHGRLSGHALELSASGRHARARLTLARSEKRPEAFRKHETPVWFRLDLAY